MHPIYQFCSRKITKMSSNEGVKKNSLQTVNLNQVMNYEGPVDPILKI